jgi:hypothetical protein
VEKSPGVHFIEMTEWGAANADLQIFCDASSQALGFWVPLHSAGFFSPLTDGSKTIFFNEALCVVSALHWATRLSPRPRKVAIHTDSLNTVEIFHTLKAEHDYNPLLMLAVTLLIKCNIQLRVFFIPGSENTVADALSRLLPHVAQSLSPSLSIQPFTPPQLAMGAHEE